MLTSWIHAVRKWHNERRAVQALALLSDDQLLDIGVNRGNLERAVRYGLEI